MLITRSSAKGKHRNLEALVDELVRLAGLLAEQHFLVADPIKVFTNDESAIQIVVNLVFHERTKNINNYFHLIQEKVKSNFINPKYLCTKMQLVDILTKGIGVNQHHHLLICLS